jgi:hypothetical protein
MAASALPVTLASSLPTPDLDAVPDEGLTPQ